MLAGTLYRHCVILLLNNTKPLHITTAEKVRFWLKTAQQREITPAPLYTGGPCGEEVRCEGVGRGTVWGMTMTDLWFRYPVSSQNPILSTYNTTKRDNSSSSVYWWVLYNWGCHIHAHVVSTLSIDLAVFKNNQCKDLRELFLIILDIEWFSIKQHEANKKICSFPVALWFEIGSVGRL